MAGARHRHAEDPAQAVFDARISLPFYPPSHVCVRRSTVGRIVFETAERGRIMRRSDDDAVRQAVLAAAVIRQDRVRYHWRGRVTIVSIDHYFDAICREYLQSSGESGLG